MPPMAPSPLDQFQAANVAPPATPPPPEDQAPLDPVGHPYEESLVITKGDAPERPSTPPPQDLSAQVRQWWARTERTPEHERVLRQIKRDTAALFGLPLAQDGVIEREELTDDQADLTNQHIYRNAIQSMALIMPDEPEVMIEPVPDFPAYDPMTGKVVPDSTNIDWKMTAFADLLDRLQKKLCPESKVMLNLRNGVQDAHHYELVFFKTTWQSDYRTETLQEDRMPDVQSMIAEAEGMMERYELGQFLDTDAEYRTMSDLINAIDAQTELPIWRGPMVKSIPLAMITWDGKVKRIEDLHQAEWIRQNYLMSRAEILRRFKAVDPDHLANATVYTSLGVKQGVDTRDTNDVTDTKPGVVQSLPSTTNSRVTNDFDLLLVAEIHDRLTQTVYVLVEGLDYYARTYTPQRATSNFFPYRAFLLNRPPGAVRLAGFSDTELQAKEQARLNRIDSDEDEAGRNAIGRGVYDKDVIEDNIGKKIAELNAHEYLGVSFKGADLAKAFVPIPGQAFDGAVFIQRRQTCQSNMRSMSGIPEQYTGASGDPKFAEQVKATATGSATLNKHRRGLAAALMTDVFTDIIELIVLNMSTDEVVAEVGENARAVWDAEPKDREAIYRRMKVTVKASTEGAPDKQETLNGLQLLAQTAFANQEPIPMKKLGPMICRVLNLPIDAKELFEIDDPNVLAAQLAQSVMKDPAQMQPPVLQQLMQVLMPLAQAEIAQMAKQRAAQAAAGAPLGAPGAPLGAPGAPPPGGSPMPTAGNAPGGGQPSPSGQPSLMPGTGAAVAQ